MSSKISCWTDSRLVMTINFASSKLSTTAFCYWIRQLLRTYRLTMCFDVDDCIAVDWWSCTSLICDISLASLSWVFLRCVEVPKLPLVWASPDMSRRAFESFPYSAWRADKKTQQKRKPTLIEMARSFATLAYSLVAFCHFECDDSHMLMLCLLCNKCRLTEEITIA